MKILLLGTGDSGKSTFARQLANLNNQMSQAHIQSFAPDLRMNALGGAQQLLDAAVQWDVGELSDHLSTPSFLFLPNSKPFVKKLTKLHSSPQAWQLESMAF